MLLQHDVLGQLKAGEIVEEALFGTPANVRLGVLGSMSRRPDCSDNAPKESSWATLQNGMVRHETFATRDEARAARFEYIGVFYSGKRRHRSLGNVNSEEFEASTRG